MPRACSVCSHERTAEIAKALAAGAPFRDVATRFGLTAASVQRHNVNCLRAARKPKAAAEPRERAIQPDSKRFDSSDPSTLISTTARLVDEALSLLEHAKRAEDHRTALSALREARDGLQLLMRAAGMLNEASQVNVQIDARRQQMAVFSKLTEDELRALAHGESIPALSQSSAAPETIDATGTTVAT